MVHRTIDLSMVVGKVSRQAAAEMTYPGCCSSRPSDHVSGQSQHASDPTSGQPGLLAWLWHGCHGKTIMAWLPARMADRPNGLSGRAGHR
jgi:hypothetical protein